MIRRVSKAAIHSIALGLILAALIPAHQVLDPVLIGEIHAGFAHTGIASSQLYPPINPRHLVSLAAATLC